MISWIPGQHTYKSETRGSLKGVVLRYPGIGQLLREVVPAVGVWVLVRGTPPGIKPEVRPEAPGFDTVRVLGRLTFLDLFWNYLPLHCP